MGFFDLNIPYIESTKRNSTADKSTRLKLAVKAMELGYSGVAYNRTITGVMSELDRCSISLFPLSSVLKVSPSISTSVNLHRRLLDVPTTAPFRQYTRLTVVVDTPSQGSSLNSGNPVLKTYDIVAVRPLKQESFDQACKNYEVDIIAIDFSQNRFRLKQPLIKAAIERGVYFEITYSGLVMDSQLRRHIISNAKLLVDWTRGKNVIFSSAAPSVTELRGPYDVANLACLLGFSMEHAKASVSKTCRSLLEKSLRKKKFYKEAIRVEPISSSEKKDVEGAGFDDWLNWDPISSGEGDLQLDDLTKSFTASSKGSNTVKAIDFVSIIDELPSDGLHIMDVVSESKSEKPYGSKQYSTVVDDVHVDSQLIDPPKNDLLTFGDCQFMSTDENLETLATVVGDEGFDMIIKEDTISKFMPAKENLETLARVEGDEACATIIKEDTISKFMPANENLKTSSVEGDEACATIIKEDIIMLNVPSTCPEAEQQNLQAEVHDSLSQLNVSDEKGGENTYKAFSTTGMLISVDDKLCSTLPCEETNNVSSDASLCPSASNGPGIEEDLEREHKRDTGDVGVIVAPVNSCLALSSASLNEGVREEHSSVMGGNELENGANSVVLEPLEDLSKKVQVEFKYDSRVNNLYAPESSLDRLRKKQAVSRRSVAFPFKRLLKPSHFKKSRKPKTRSTVLSLSQLLG